MRGILLLLGMTSVRAVQSLIGRLPSTSDERFRLARNALFHCNTSASCTCDTDVHRRVYWWTNYTNQMPPSLESGSLFEAGQIMRPSGSRYARLRFCVRCAGDSADANVTRLRT